MHWHLGACNKQYSDKDIGPLYRSDQPSTVRRHLIRLGLTQSALIGADYPDRLGERMSYSSVPDGAHALCRKMNARDRIPYRSVLLYRYGILKR